MRRSVDRTAFAVTKFAEAAEADKAYWAAAGTDERMAALELQRQIAYGYKVAPRMEKVFEVIRLDDLKAACAKTSKI